MKVTIKGKEIELFYTYRMIILYENITEESYETAMHNLSNSKRQAALFYSCIIGSAKKKKIELDFNFDEYMNWLDDNGDQMIINKFLNFLLIKVEEKNALLKKEQESEDDLPKSTKKAKN